MINKQIQRIYTVNIFIIVNFLNCNISNIVNTNIFVIFCQFLTRLDQNFDIDHVVVKIISSIFNIYLFYYSHFILLLIIFCMINIIICRNIFFITIHAFIVNKISTMLIANAITANTIKTV